jgi:hypothetical protein
LGSVNLELGGKPRLVHTNLGESDEHFFGLAAVNRQHVIHLAVIGEGEQRLLRHRVDGSWSCERLKVKDIGSLRVFRAGAGPQEALRLRSGSGRFLPPGRS